VHFPDAQTVFIRFLNVTIYNLQLASDRFLKAADA